jgi:hypothetical protein
MGGGVFFVLIILAFAGRGLLRASPKTAALERAAYLWVAGLSIVAGLIVFVLMSLFAHQDAELCAVMAVMSGLIAALVLAFLIPVVVFVFVHVFAPPLHTWGNWRREAALRREERRREAQQKRDQAAYQRAAPERERAARAGAAAQKRRDDARAQCELLYSLHAPDIGQRFARQAFDDFLKKYMGDERMPEDVEQRSQQLQAIIQQHLQKAGKAQKKMTLAELAQWFLGEKQQIDAAPLPPEDKQALLAQLEERFAKLQEKYIRGIEP